MKSKCRVERDLNQILEMLENPEKTRNKYNLEKTDHYDAFPHFMLGYIRQNIKNLLEKE